VSRDEISDVRALRTRQDRIRPALGAYSRRVNITHVVWDWNGTLLDDFDIIVQATADSCGALGLEPLDADAYRTHFTRPIRLFYEAIFKREISAPELSALSRSFRARYRLLAVDARLAPDALQALQAVRGVGLDQSLLSMWEHEELVGAVERVGIREYFAQIDGQPGPGGMDSKTQLLVEHLDAVPVEPASVLMVGDSLDDAAAARSVGAACVLVEGGSHHPSDLRSVGVPVAACLVEALEVAGVATDAAAGSGGPGPGLANPAPVQAARAARLLPPPRDQY